MFDAFDRKMMERAIELAYRRQSPPYPNPRVGAVITKNGDIISEGAHISYDSPHAEYVALEKVGFSAEGATIYVTLEPCCPFEGKRNPSCAELIVKAGIRRAVISTLHAIDGENGGLAILKGGQVIVETGLLSDEAGWLTKGLFHFRKTGMPYVTAKWAMTADGRIAPGNRRRISISGTKSVEFVHKLRHKNDAVLVGIGTVLADNPMLNCRFGGSNHPARVVIDPALKTPLGSNVAMPSQLLRTLIICDEKAPAKKWSSLESQGVVVTGLKAGKDGILPVGDILRIIAENKLYSVLVEGGAAVHGHFFDARLVDEYIAIIAPEIMGGADSLCPVSGSGIEHTNDTVKLKNVKIEVFPPDIVLTGTPEFN